MMLMIFTGSDGRFRRHGQLRDDSCSESTYSPRRSFSAHFSGEDENILAAETGQSRYL